MFLFIHISSKQRISCCIYSISVLINRQISYISKYFTLKIGDVIFTGTPAGVGKVFVDDILEGYLENNKICLSGFSQGCMMSINVGLSEKEKLAGILGFSGKIINKTELNNRIFTKPSTLLIHGDQDEIVPPVNLLEAKDFFERNKIDIITKMVKGCGHNIPIEASSSGLIFLKKIFNIKS